MIYFSDASGTLTRCVPEQVYQGSAEGNRLFLVAPFAQNAEVFAAFRLPDGSCTERYRLAYVGAVEGIGGGVYSWQCALPACVTAQYGNVTVQFFRTVAGEELAAFASQFTVERGVPPTLPASPAADVYRAIVEVLAAIGADLHNGFYAARSIYAWNASYVYGANEITFYPVGEHGALVRSLHADNDVPPYAENGALNGEDWEETINFDTVSEQYFEKLQAAADQAESAAARAQAFAQQLASVLDREVLVVQSLPPSPQPDAFYLVPGKGETGSLFELWTYDGAWVSFGGADIVLNTTDFYTETLAAAGWSGNRQTLSVPGVAEGDAVYAVPAEGYAASYLAAGIRAEQTAEDGVVFSCKNVPSGSVQVSLAVTKRQDAPLSATEFYYTKEETDGLISAEAAARAQADGALGGRIDGIVAGTTAVGQATNAAYAASAGSATTAETAANATHAQTAETATNATNAENAASATYAASAGSAATAETAANATHAQEADTATNAANATYAASAGSAATAETASRATADGDGNNIAATYAKASDVQSTLTQLQGGSIVVGRATADAAGNNIASTYATKAEVSASGGGGSGSEKLYLHNLFVSQGDDVYFTAQIFNRSATPISTAQALVNYLAREGFQVYPERRPLLISGDYHNSEVGNQLFYGIGENTQYPGTLGVLYRSGFTDLLTENGLIITSIVVTDQVIEI